VELQPLGHDMAADWSERATPDLPLRVKSRPKWCIVQCCSQTTHPSITGISSSTHTGSSSWQTSSQQNDAGIPLVAFYDRWIWSWIDFVLKLRQNIQRARMDEIALGWKSHVLMTKKQPNTSYQTKRCVDHGESQYMDHLMRTFSPFIYALTSEATRWQYCLNSTVLLSCHFARIDLLRPSDVCTLYEANVVRNRWYNNWPHIIMFPRVWRPNYYIHRCPSTMIWFYDLHVRLQLMY
jgi:hypothetical protein